MLFCQDKYFQGYLKSNFVINVNYFVTTVEENFARFGIARDFTKVITAPIKLIN